MATSSITTTHDGRFKVSHSYKAKPSWRRDCEGRATVTIEIEPSGGLSIHSEDVPEGIRGLKETFVSIPRELAVALADAIKQVNQCVAPDYANWTHLLGQIDERLRGTQSEFKVEICGKTRTLAVAGTTAYLDNIIGKHIAVESFKGLVCAPGSYRPSIYLGGKSKAAQQELLFLTLCYNLAQELRHDPRRVYKGDWIC